VANVIAAKTTDTASKVIGSSGETPKKSWLKPRGADGGHDPDLEPSSCDPRRVSQHGAYYVRLAFAKCHTHSDLARALRDYMREHAVDSQMPAAAPADERSQQTQHLRSRCQFVIGDRVDRANAGNGCSGSTAQTPAAAPSSG